MVYTYKIVYYIKVERRRILLYVKKLRLLRLLSKLKKKKNKNKAYIGFIFSLLDTFPVLVYLFASLLYCYQFLHVVGAMRPRKE